MDQLEFPDEDVRVLVHIVSHQDIVFDITPRQAKGSDVTGSAAGSEPRGHLFAKPKFHRFNLATKKAYWHMTPEPQAAAPGTAADAFPFRERMFSDPDRPDLGQWPLGLDLSEPLDFASKVRFPWSASRDVEMGWEDFSWNNPAPGDGSRSLPGLSDADMEAPPAQAVSTPPGLALPAGCQSSPSARAILFPLVATLLPLWRLSVQRGTSKRPGKTRFVLLLVSGSGRRRDDTSVQDNSTRYTARLIRRFVSHAFRDVEVFVAHSHHDVYRFEQNVRFLRSVQTAIRSLRHRVVLRHGSDWAKHFGVSVTLGGGTPARVAAATASLRVFSPQMLHMVELKRLWFLDQLRFADVDHRSFEAGEAQFEAAAEALPGPLRMLVREMRAHCRAFEAVRDSASLGEVSHGVELELAGQMPDQAEVGSCLGFVEAPFGCCYDDVFAALAQEGGTVLRRRGGREAARRAGAKSSAASSHSSPVTMADRCGGCSDPGCTAGRREDSGSGSEGPRAPDSEEPGALPGIGRAASLSTPGSPLRAMSLSPSCELSEQADDPAEAAKARTRGLGAGVAASDVVSNPLPPCGSCSEWLKKINEVQPDFRVLMFRDTSCSTAIVRSVE